MTETRLKFNLKNIKHSRHLKHHSALSNKVSDYLIRKIQYNLVECVGVGGFASVHKAQHILTGEVVAAKIVNTNGMDEW